MSELNPELTSWLDWLATKLQGSAHLCPPRAGAIAGVHHCDQIFPRTGVQTQVLQLVQWKLYLLSQLPNPPLRTFLLSLF